MRVSFWAYYAQDNKTKTKRKIDLSSILDGEIIKKSNHSLQCGDYYIYMHTIDTKTILFTKTNDSDLINKINKTNNSIRDIRDSLADDELLGFPSFLFINDGIIGFASSFLGPKIRELPDFIKGKKLLSESEDLIIEPLMRGVTKADALNMSFIGRTTLRIESGKSLTKTILRSVGVASVSDELLDGIEIILKPKRAKDIKGMTKEIISSSYGEVDGISIKAKETAADLLTEYYLDGKGHVGCNLPKKASNAEIANEIYTAFAKMKPTILESYEHIKNELLP